MHPSNAKAERPMFPHDLPKVVTSKVASSIPGECWLWTACRNAAGYGELRVGGKHWLAHRYIYTLVHGEIPETLIIMHTCDTPACVNPAHLQLGTHLHNVRDKEAKGRGNAGAANGQAKLTEADVAIIRSSVSKGSFAQAQLARAFNVNRSCINKIVHKSHWRSI